MKEASAGHFADRVCPHKYPPSSIRDSAIAVRMQAAIQSARHLRAVDQRGRGQVKFYMFTIAFMIFAPTISFADSTKSVMREFGLDGTFSNDCSKSVSNGAGRTTYVIPTFGQATINTIRQDPHDSTRILNATLVVLKAELVTDEKIRVVQQLSESNGTLSCCRFG